MGKLNSLIFATFALVSVEAQATQLATQSLELSNRTELSKSKMFSAIAKLESLNLEGEPVPTADKLSAEEAILDFYGNVQAECALQLNRLETSRDGFAKTKASLTAWGSLVTLIGGVTAYAPAKAILMGVGISSGHDSSVLGGLVGSADDSRVLSQTTIDNLRKGYVAAVTKFNTESSTSDPTGYKRKILIIELRSACVGLSSILDATTS